MAGPASGSARVVLEPGSGAADAPSLGTDMISDIRMRLRRPGMAA